MEAMEDPILDSSATTEVQILIAQHALSRVIAVIFATAAAGEDEGHDPHSGDQPEAD